MNHSATSAGELRRIARWLLQCALCVLLVSGVSSAHDSPDILHIENEYQAIRKALPTMTTASRSVDGPDGERYKASAHRDATGALRVSRFEFSSPTHKRITEHYHAGGVLIFALYQHQDYDMPLDYAEEVDRYYFSGGRMIQWLNRDHEWVNADSKAFREAEKEVLEWSEMLQSAAAEWPAEAPGR